MKFIDHLDDNHIEQLHTLYRDEWWTKHRALDDTKKCVACSQLCIAAVDDDDRLLGFVRVLTDYVYKALIFDLIICHDYRNQGLGKLLLAKVVEHEDLSSVDHIELYCLDIVAPFYEELGFSDDVSGVKLMRLERSDT